jgi:WhiB family redox-sensing transcriptional regulator
MSLTSLLKESGDVSWIPQAACRGADQSDFFPSKKGESAKRAKKVCQGCPVRLDCLDYALRHRLFDGVWGGCGERERRTLARKRGLAVGICATCSDVFSDAAPSRKYCSVKCRNIGKNARQAVRRRAGG